MKIVRSLLLISLLCCAAPGLARKSQIPAAVVTAQTKQSVAAQSGLPDRLPASEFSRLIRELSEEGGSFHSDNLVSNETSLLHITDKLKQLSRPGGAYIGVGPEQNFTYIAKVRPRIAFIVDIRHLAAIQHLMYKAIFHLSPDRAQFLSRLLSRPLLKGRAPGANAPVNELLDYFGATPADEKLYASSLAEIGKMIRKDFQYQLSEDEQKQLEYLLTSFRDGGLDISYQTRYGFQRGNFPTLRELIAQTDLNGKTGHFLTNNVDYEFVRQLHLKNLIIPVTGDFAGQKAFAAIGDYLSKKGLVVSAFYTSNVEQYLFQNQVFDAFAANVKKLPVNDQSLFIRAVSGRSIHPARVPGHRLITLLQRIQVFLKDYDEGRYQSYWSLVTTNYIAADQQ
ncbi:MAG TPA: hypothetical protein VFD58_03125 [Blastocatellia bacterium]|nr:hypothetical protein [Blastocatellia bacterium]